MIKTEYTTSMNIYLSITHGNIEYWVGTAHAGKFRIVILYKIMEKFSAREQQHNEHTNKTIKMSQKHDKRTDMLNYVQTINT